MQEIFKLQQKIVPELLDLLGKRYNILKAIYYNEPIGRRILANKLGVGERVVRTEINFLKKQNLIDIGIPGMSVTDEGEEVLDKLKDFIHEFKGLSEIEGILIKKLKTKKVIIVPGNVEDDKTVMSELGRTASKYIQSIIEDGNIIAITGGTTIKNVIDNFRATSKYKNIVVVPARGGMAKNVEIEANTLSANLANKLGATYKLLHVPDNLSNETLCAVLNEKSIKDVIDTLHEANIIVYGIGRADDMIKRRELSQEETEEILSQGSIGEAFGYFFNSEGEVVYYTPSVGLKIDALKNVSKLVAVAGGKSKARAIISTQIRNEKSVLIIDEGAALEMIKILS
ncbi:MAG: sugar-binding domain-containing protein [Clostridium sp.]|nr:sugar-binding domain-containing protein [Clostridium sp.]